MQPRLALSFGNFFVGAHFFLVLYTSAPYLATMLPDEYIGLVFSLGAVLTLAAFPFVPALVRKLGAKKLALSSAVIGSCVTLGLAVSPGPVFAIAFIALFYALAPISAYFLDLLLEATTEHEGATGRVRTLFITFGSMAVISSPLITGYLLGATELYSKVFLLSAASLAPFFLILLFARIPEGNPPAFAHMKDVAHCLLRDPDFKAVGIAYGVLQFFYHLAPFFIPLYLHTELGIPWSELGWIFAVMLLPFLLLEYPAGWLADHMWGDQEMMAIGFLILGASLAAIGFISLLTPTVTMVIVLILSRVGAALAEAMCETHFFRRVSERDANTVGVFRMMRPLGALAAPLICSIILVFTSYNVLFFITGLAIVVFGVADSLSIKDVR
jgi:MFS family permease